MGDICKNGSDLKKWLTLGKMAQIWKIGSNWRNESQLVKCVSLG